MSFIKPEITSSTSTNVAADWIELKALESDDSLFRASELRRMLDVQSEYGGDSYDSDDLHIEDAILRWFAEIKCRENVLSNAYPFFIQEDEIRLKAIDDSNKPGIYSYILCLFLSHANDTEALNGKTFLNLQGNDPAREYFQIISTIASSGYLKGSSISFGWPRQDASKFVDALKRVSEKALDGAGVRETAHAAAPLRVKDFEIDIISWVPVNDNMPGKVFLISQVASGYNWKEKPLRSSILRDLHPWLDSKFASDENIATGLFIPFCIESDHGESLDKTLWLLSSSSRKNIIFYRYRIPFYVQQAFESGLSGQAGIEIERENDMDKMYDWVDDKRTILKPQAF